MTETHEATPANEEISKRRVGLKGTPMAQAQCQTIRLKLLKIGAQIRVTVRRVLFCMAGGYPFGEIFAGVYRNLMSTA